MKNFTSYVKKDYSAIVLILVNLIPLLSVLVFDWNLFNILFLYWIESAIIGFYNIIKMALVKNLSRNDDSSKPNDKVLDEIIEKISQTKYLKEVTEVFKTILKIFIILFFIVHFGFFMFVHLFFILGFFKDLALDQQNIDLIFNFKSGSGSAFVNLIKDLLISRYLFIPFFGLFISHGLSFFSNYVAKKEFFKNSLPDQMFKPYSRIIVMHFVLIITGFFITSIGAPIIAIFALVFLKILFDLRAHIKEHRTFVKF